MSRLSSVRRAVLSPTTAWAAGAWLAATALSLALAASAAGPGGPGDALQVVRNTVWMMTVFGRGVAAVLNLWLPLGPASFNAIASGVGWLPWAVAVWMFLTLRRSIRSKRKGTNLPDEQQLASPVLSRRAVLADAGAGVIGLAASGALAKGAALDAWDLQVRAYRVLIADLPASLDGLRIVQISDTHLGTRVNTAFIAECVRGAIALRPDVVALTGDYIHNGVWCIEQAAELFKPLAAELPAGAPVVGVLGNHDWYGDGREMSAALRGAGVTMIDNGRVYLDSETRRLVTAPTAECLCIAGLGDLLMDVVDPAAALGGVPAHVPRVLLSHHPDTAEDPRLVGLDRLRVDLQLSGHTHGGQVRVPFLGTPIVPSEYGSKYAGGLVRGPAFPVVVSRGVGMSILPVRFNVPPELVEVTLVRDVTARRNG